MDFLDSLRTVPCWCGAMLISVPTHRAKAGRTNTCGLINCRSPEQLKSREEFFSGEAREPDDG